jgi:hypothetical protein
MGLSFFRSAARCRSSWTSMAAERSAAACSSFMRMWRWASVSSGGGIIARESGSSTACVIVSLLLVLCDFMVAHGGGEMGEEGRGRGRGGARDSEPGRTGQGI